MKLVAKIALFGGAFLWATQSLHAQSFGHLYAFGDSLSDCCAGIGGPFINRPGGTAPAPSWLTQLAPQIGASYTATSQYNLAIGGAQSGRNNIVPILDALYGQPTGFLSQVGRFPGPVRSNDIAGIWIGTNDIWPSSFPNPAPYLVQGYEPSALAPLGAQPSVGALSSYITGNVRTGIGQLVAAGFRNIVLISPYDLSLSTATSGSNLSLSSQYSIAVRNQLAGLYTPGVNTYFLDTLTLMNRVQADPSSYGFTHFLSADSCSASPVCAAGPLSLQKSYVFNDSIHVTSAFDGLMARYIANVINAREAFSAPGDISQGAGLAFSNSLIDRLDAQRRTETNPFNAQASYLPTKARPANIGAPTDNFSVFLEGVGAGISMAGGPTPNGPANSDVSAQYAGITIGVDYRVAPSVRIGGAFNFLNSSTDLPGLSQTHIGSNSFQGGAYISLSQPHYFLDAAATYGLTKLSTRRPGVMDAIYGSIYGSPEGNTFTVAGRTGYLFDIGAFKAGPIADLAYSNVRVGNYSERGDDLLTLGVLNQNFDGLTGGVGAQIRANIPMARGSFNPFINLTAEHDFIGGVRSITSFSTDAPLLLISTTAGRPSNDLYGKVAGGFDIGVSGGLRGLLTASSTFGRTGGDSYSLSGGLQYGF